MAGLTAQVGLHALALDHANVRLHHQIENAWLAEFPTADRALILLQVLFRQLIDTETPLAILALYQPVHEVFHVTAGLPHTRVSNDISLDPYHVIIPLHHRPPPVAPDIVSQLNAQRPKGIKSRNPTLALRTGVDKASSLT